MVRLLLEVIETFGDSETESIYDGKRSRKLPSDIQHRARRKLRMINQALSLQDLRVPPANRLEPLKGDKAGFWSIRVNQQWRIIFRWDDGRANDVSIIDYH
jgi:proteic killer suppression protein